MKKRKGFVSNSSSTSFAVVGITLDEDQFKEVFGVEEYYAVEELTGLEVGQAYQYNDIYYVGLSWDKQEIGETKGEFFARIEAALVPYLGEDVKVLPISGGWYDG